jgi:hypothetical protein
MRPNKPPPPVLRLDPDALPIWLPDERGAREAFEIVRDHWWAVKQYAETFRVRGVAIVDRLTAEKAGDWPPAILLQYKGKEYAVGGCRATFANPAMQARMDQDPRRVRVLVIGRGVPAGVAGPADAVELLFHLDCGPAGVKLAGGDRAPGAES